MNKTIAFEGPTQEHKAKMEYLESLGIVIESFTLYKDNAVVNFTDDYDYELSLDEFEIGDPAHSIYQRAEMYSCCGDVLDKDYMICPSCKEHC